MKDMRAFASSEARRLCSSIWPPTHYVLTFCDVSNPASSPGMPNMTTLLSRALCCRKHKKITSERQLLWGVSCATCYASCSCQNWCLQAATSCCQTGVGIVQTSQQSISCCLSAGASMQYLHEAPAGAHAISKDPQQQALDVKTPYCARMVQLHFSSSLMVTKNADQSCATMPTKINVKHAALGT